MLAALSVVMHLLQLRSENGAADYAAWTLARAQWQVWLLYLPCLLFVMRRPNVAPADDQWAPFSHASTRGGHLEKAYRLAAYVPRPTSGLSGSDVMRIPERGARLARREERACRPHVSDEQRRQAGVPAARTVRGGVETGCPARKPRYI